MSKKTDNLVYWSWNEDVTPEDFILRLAPLVCDAMTTAREQDTDMLMSDYRNLCDAANRLSNAVSDLRKKEAAQ